MDRGAWQATVHGVAELDMTEHARNTLKMACLATCLYENYIWKEGRKEGICNLNM